MGRGVRGEKIDRFVHAHRQHFADRFSLPAHRERLGAEAESAADLAGHFYVRQETHLDSLDSLAFAGFAAPALGVERKTACAPAPHARSLPLAHHTPIALPQPSPLSP